MPPRAAQRNFSTSASIRVSDFIRNIGRHFGSRFTPGPALAARIERFLASPELWLSLALPGAGHVYLGRLFTGILVFAVTAAFLAGFLIVSSDELFADVDLPLMIFGAFLGAVHMHAWSVGTLLRSAYRSCIPRPLAVLIILVVLSTQFYVSNRLLQAYLGHTGRHVIIRGATFWAPALLPGDRIVINKVPAADMQHGDLIMVSNTICERVLGVASDVVTIDGGRILRNDIPLLGTYSMPLTALNTSNVPDQAIRGDSNAHQQVVVPADHVVYLWWGKELRAVPVVDIQGRIDGIAAPAERRCRFVDGRPVPHNRSFRQVLFGR